MNSSNIHIPPEVYRHTPLITPAGYQRQKGLLEHPHAPRWNYTTGDRLIQADLVALERFREQLASRTSHSTPPEEILSWVHDRRSQVPHFQKMIPTGLNLERDWAAISTMQREDIAIRVETLIPDDVNLERLMIYKTSGTTGHSLLVPHHPLTAASYMVLLELTLQQYGLSLPTFTAEQVACFLVGAQQRTVAFATVLSAWGQAGYIKLNLNAAEWRTPESRAHFFEDCAPALLTGDPLSFAELMRLDLPVRPLAMLSTAVAMGEKTQQQLVQHFGCPVIDWYSLTETGPIGYGCAQGEGYHILPHDIYVEVINAVGEPVKEGKRGEITVTGGRNPFLPLLRYRTGDWGYLDFSPCICGDSMPRIRALEGRQPVFFKAVDGSLVNSVDISRMLRRFPIVQHHFHQSADGDCQLIIRPSSLLQASDRDVIYQKLQHLFGSEIQVDIQIDLELGEGQEGGKVTPFSSA